MGLINELLQSWAVRVLMRLDEGLVRFEFVNLF